MSVHLSSEGFLNSYIDDVFHPEQSTIIVCFDVKRMHESTKRTCCSCYTINPVSTIYILWHISDWMWKVRIYVVMDEQVRSTRSLSYLLTKVGLM